jgi:hypothetical protein
VYRRHSGLCPRIKGGDSKDTPELDAGLEQEGWTRLAGLQG